MATFSFFARSKENDQTDQATSPGGGTGSGVLPPHRSEIVISEETALSIASVYRCVSIISNTLSQLPLSVKRGDDEVVSSLARRPDINSNTNDFFGSTVTSLALNGNAYWWVSRDKNGEVKNLEVLNPRAVIVNREDKVGAPITYDYAGKRVNKKNIKHIKLMVLPGHYKGIGPLQAARDEIENAKRLLHYSNSFLENGGVPTGVLSSDQYLNAEQADSYREAWGAAQETRGLAVLGAGLSYSPISLTPEDLMLLENLKYSVLGIARLFGIPPVFLGAGLEGGSLTYSTAETQSILFLQTTLAEYINSIEEAFTDLLPRGQVAKFRLDNLMRADLKTRVDAYATLIDKEVITPTEVRLMEGYSPEPVGEFFKQAPIQTPLKTGQED